MTGLFPAGGAKLSACGLYRYRLWRTWDEGREPLVFAMLNPSTANAEEDDPTIRRCIGYARALGHGGIVVCNLFAYRATDPDVLPAVADPVGPSNDEEIAVAALARRVIAAWGAVPKHRKRADKVLGVLRNFAASVECLKRTKDGFPAHPLYLKADLKPIPFGG